MKVQIRETNTKKEEYFNKRLKKKVVKTTEYETGAIKEIEVNPQDINAFTIDKNSRLIGIDKKIYKLTLASWKQVKKELDKLGLLNRFDLSHTI